MSDEQHDPAAAMEWFEQFARKVFSMNKPGAEREAEFPARALDD